MALDKAQLRTNVIVNMREDVRPNMETLGEHKAVIEEGRVGRRVAAPARSPLTGGLFGLFFILGVLRDAGVMFRSPVALGTDGYYYAVQARHVVSHLALYYPSPTPAVLYLIAAATLPFRDPIVSLKVCSLVLSVALAAGVFEIVRSATERVWCAALAAALVSAPSMHLFMLVEFVNNLGALALLAVAVAVIVRASAARRPVWWFGVALLVCALASHRMAWVLVPACAILYCAAGVVLSRQTAASRRSTAATIIAAAWACTAFLPRWSDRLRGELLDSAAFPLRFVNPTGTWEIAVLLLAAPFAIWIATDDSGWPPRVRKLAIVTSLWTFIATLNPWLNHSMAALGIVGRFDHAAFVQTALLVPLLFLDTGMDRATRRLAAAAGASVLVAACLSPIPYAARADFLDRRQHVIDGLRRVTLPPGTRIVAAHGDEFLVTYVLGLEADQRYRPSSNPARTYWLVRAPRSNLGQVVSEENGLHVIVLSHVELTRLDASLDPEQRQVLRSANSHWRKYVEPAAQGTQGAAVRELLSLTPPSPGIDSGISRRRLREN
jgi:hypothetical protein